MPKPAITDRPLHELIRQRWSPRAFSEQALDTQQVLTLFEAARWAASCFNEQPWIFLAGTRDQSPDDHAQLAGCLLDGNRAWAARAPLLMLSVARLRFARNDNPNRHAWHDVGMSTATLVLQAQALGLFAHMMAGFDRDHARQVLAIPDDHEPVAMTAIGYIDDPSILPETLRERETAPRQRHGIESFVFGASWGATSQLVTG